MTIFATKDWSAAKSDKIRTYIGRKMGLAVPATNNQVENQIEGWLKEVVDAGILADKQAQAAIAAAAEGL